MKRRRGKFFPLWLNSVGALNPRGLNPTTSPTLFQQISNERRGIFCVCLVTSRETALFFWCSFVGKFVPPSLECVSQKSLITVIGRVGVLPLLPLAKIKPLCFWQKVGVFFSISFLVVFLSIFFYLLSKLHIYCCIFVIPSKMQVRLLQ